MTTSNCDDDDVDVLLASIGPGEVRTIFAASTSAAMARLRTHAVATDRITVIHCWRRLPDVHAIVDESVTALGRAAFDAWPDWYPGAPRHFTPGNGTEAAVLNEAALRTVLVTWPAVNAAWLRTAAARCAERRVPLLPDFAAATQARQLSLALSTDGPIIAMAFDPPPEDRDLLTPRPGSSRLRAFASAAAWLAKETQAGIVAVLPESLARSAALDSISYAACHLDTSPAPGTRQDQDRSVTTVWPIVGRPHPASPGECILSDRLAADPELRGLFHFNQRIGTVRDTSHLVDLVWPDGSVIVEVDGWGHLMSRNYRGDRHRDYELLISGYLVLRLPHEQVVEDPAIAIEKIRDVVHFRRGRSESASRIAKRVI